MATNLYEMPVLTTGVKKDLFGREAVVTKDVLDDMASSYDPENIFESQVVIGHKEDLQKMLKNDKAPSFGQMLSFEVRKGTKRDPNEGYTLVSQMDLTDIADKWVKDKHYRHRSMAYYEPDHDDNPKPGHYYPRHMALLGLSPPSDKNLGEAVKLNNIVKLSETNNSRHLIVSLAEEAEEAEKIIDAPAFDAPPEEILKFMTENAGDMFDSILTEGNFGFKGEIMEFIPPPSRENNFLRDEETGIISGKFVDEEQEVYLFEIDPKTNKKSFTPENKEDEPSDNDDDPGINTSEEENLKTFSEYGNGSYMLNKGDKVYHLVVCEPARYGKAMGMIPALNSGKEEEFTALTETQVKALEEGIMEEKEKPLESMMSEEEKSEMAALREFRANAEKVKQEKEDEKLTAFAESLFDSGKLLKTEVSTKEVVGLLKILKSPSDDTKSLKAFSESTGSKTSPFELIKTIFEEMPEKINLSDVTVLAESTEKGKKVKVAKNMVLPKGGIIDADSSDLHTKAVALCEKQEGLEYSDAIKMVLEES